MRGSTGLAIILGYLLSNESAYEPGLQGGGGPIFFFPPKLPPPKPAVLCEEHHIVLAAAPVACGHSHDHRSCVVARNQRGDHVTLGQLRRACMRKSNSRGAAARRCGARV